MATAYSALKYLSDRWLSLSYLPDNWRTTASLIIEEMMTRAPAGKEMTADYLANN